MATLTINLTEEQLTKVVEAYRIIQEFLASAISPNELYQAEFVAGLKESDDDIRTGSMKEVHSFNDFLS